MDFSIDFSQLDFTELQRSNISPDEINSLFNNQSSYFEENDDFMYVLGFSHKRKFIQVAYRMSKNINFEIEVLQIGLPDEKDIKENWCGSIQD